MNRFESIQNYIASYISRHRDLSTAGELEKVMLTYLIEREWRREHSITFTDASFCTNGKIITMSDNNTLHDEATWNELDIIAHDVLTRYGWVPIEELYKDFYTDITIKKYTADKMQSITEEDLDISGKVYEDYCFRNKTQFSIVEVAQSILELANTWIELDKLNILIYLCQCEAVFQSGKMLFTEFTKLDKDIIPFVVVLPKSLLTVNDYAKNIIAAVLSEYEDKPLAELKKIVERQPAWIQHLNTHFLNWTGVIHSAYLYQARLRRVQVSKQQGLELYNQGEEIYDVHTIENCIFNTLITPKYAVSLPADFLEPDMSLGSNGIVIFDNLLSSDLRQRFTLAKVDTGVICSENLWHTDILPDAVMRRAAEYYSNLNITNDVLSPKSYEENISKWLAR